MSSLHSETGQRLNLFGCQPIRPGSILLKKLWRWLRSTVLKMHRLTEDWKELLNRVHAFLNQFADGSQDLLRYLGLLGDGKLARAIAIP